MVISVVSLLLAAAITSDADWRAHCDKARDAAIARIRSAEAIEFCDGRKLAFSGVADTNLDGRIDSQELARQVRAREQDRIIRSNSLKRGGWAPIEYRCSWLYHAQKFGVAVRATAVSSPVWELTPAWEFRVGKTLR